MRVAISGASGLIGRRLVSALTARGDEVIALSRSNGTVRWDPATEPAPAAALGGVDAVVHLAGESIAQRWSARARAAISSSRTIGTANLVAGIAAATPRPPVLLSASAVGYYGNRGDELLGEDSPPGTDWLAGVCVEWEQAALSAAELGLRVCVLRAGVVLDRDGGALAKMLPPFRLGVGGPVAGGKQYMAWIHVDDMVGLYLAAIDGEDWSGPVNGCAPGAVTNAEFSHALGRALHRPAVLPVPGLALRAMYGEMASIVTGGQRMVPARAQALNYTWAHTDLDEALRSTLAD
jgi:hypothetical protein